jgi:hypothetical protein
MAIPIRPPSPQRQPKTWSRQGPYPQDPPHRLRPANRPVPPNGTCPCAVRRRYRPRKQLPASCSLVTVQRVLKWQLPGKARPRTARAPRRSRDCQFARPPSVAFPPSDFAGVMRAGTAMLCVDLRAPVIGVVTPPDWPYRVLSLAILAVSIAGPCASAWLLTGGSVSAAKVISSCSACLRELDPISAMSTLRISAINLESLGCGRAARGSFVQL